MAPDIDRRFIVDPKHSGHWILSFSSLLVGLGVPTWTQSDRVEFQIREAELFGAYQPSLDLRLRHHLHAVDKVLRFSLACKFDQFSFLA